MYAMSTLDNDIRKRLARQTCGTLLFLHLSPCSWYCCFNCSVMDWLKIGYLQKRKKEKKGLYYVSNWTQPVWGKTKQICAYLPACLTACHKVQAFTWKQDHFSPQVWALGNIMLLPRKNTPIVTRLHVSNAAKDQMGQFQNCYVCKMMGHALATVPELGKTRPENGAKELIICPCSSLLHRKRFESFLFAEAIPDCILFYVFIFVARIFGWKSVVTETRKQANTNGANRQTNKWTSLTLSCLANKCWSQVYQLC